MVVMVAMGVMAVMDTNGELLEGAGRSLVQAAAAAQVAIDSTGTSMGNGQWALHINADMTQQN